MRKIYALLLSSALCSALYAKDGLLIAHVTDGYDETIHGEIKTAPRIDAITNPALKPKPSKVTVNPVQVPVSGGIKDDGIGIKSQKVEKDYTALDNIVVKVKKDEDTLIKELGLCEASKSCKDIEVSGKKVPYAEAKKEYMRIKNRNTCITQKCIIGTAVSDKEAWFHIAVKTALDPDSYFYGISLDYAGEKTFERLMRAQSDLRKKYGEYKIVKSKVSSFMTKKNERVFEVATILAKQGGGNVTVKTLGTMVTKSAPKKGVVDLKIKEIVSIKDK